MQLNSVKVSSSNHKLTLKANQLVNKEKTQESKDKRVEPNANYVCEANTLPKASRLPC